MYAFLCIDKKPVTIEAHSHLRWENDVRIAFRNYWPNATIQNGIFYGVVYYFHNRPTQIDADNLCKPVFDALKNELYADDKYVKLVRSATFDRNANDIEILDLTNMPGNVFPDFIDKLDYSDDILYVEIGDLDLGMFEFGCDQ